MPTRTGGEKAKTEKRIRSEKIIMTVVGVLALSVFLILGVISSKKSGCFDLYPEVTPNVAFDPLYDHAKEINSVYGGDLTPGDDSYLLNFKSKADGCDTAVKIYYKSGIMSIRIVRSLGILTTTPEPTDMFSDNENNTETKRIIANRDRIAEETADLISSVYETGDRSELVRRINEMLSSFENGKTVKSSFLYGVYVVKTELDGGNGLLTIVAEPA